MEKTQVVVEVPVQDHGYRGKSRGLWGDHCKVVSCSRKASRTRQACLTSGGTRIASDHWVRDGMRPAFRFRPRAGV